MLTYCIKVSDIILIHIMNYLLKFPLIFIKATYLHYLNKTALKSKY